MIDASVVQGLQERLERVRERIGKAAGRSGRDEREVALVAVTKRQSLEAIEAASRAGLVEFGENHVQEAMTKRGALAGCECQWHLLGHLQSNKAKAAVETFDLIQTVDSVRIARQISRQAEAQGKIQRVLLQVRLGDEQTKSGCEPEEAPGTAEQILDLPGVSLRGLMGIAPRNQVPRPYFRSLRRLMEELPPAARTVLSMGMSGDYETAVEEGATMIRIGTALFGARAALDGGKTPAGQ